MPFEVGCITTRIIASMFREENVVRLFRPTWACILYILWSKTFLYETFASSIPNVGDKLAHRVNPHLPVALNPPICGMLIVEFGLLNIIRTYSVQPNPSNLPQNRMRKSHKTRKPFLLRIHLGSIP